MDKQILQDGILRNISELREALCLVVESEKLSKEDITGISDILHGVAFDLKIIAGSTKRQFTDIKKQKNETKDI